jgi:glycine/D-amino acid oxidase-like deaminating enzyme
LREILQQNRYRAQKNLSLKKVCVVDDPLVINEVKEYAGSFTVLSPERIKLLLETEQDSFIAAVGEQTGCMNSAVFTYELVGYLAHTYPERFTFYEHSPVSDIELLVGQARVHCGEHYIESERVVLCTNGFAGFTFSGLNGEQIAQKFARDVSGRIGYMIGYLDAPSLHTYPIELHPYTVRYHTSFGKDKLPMMPLMSYFYLTHWPFHVSEPDDVSLVCIGGPEEEASPQARIAPLPSMCIADVRWVINDFLKTYYRHYNLKQRQGFFCWRGLMGYTRSMVRLIGPEPLYPSLMYNLGCNGVGILPSVYGASKIADYCLGKTFKPSLFDPV